jgi:tRNA pseudouridine13 synthase
MNYLIKSKPEDFIVKEIIDVKSGQGIYSYFRLKKINLTTIESCQRISDSLKIKLKDIGFAGTKDKNAITEQIISIKNINKDRIKNLNFKNIELEYVGNGSDPISLGDLQGNEFVITLREVKKEPRKIDFITNYFDDQRFSSNNVEIGIALLKKDFKKASELISESNKFFVEDYLKEHPNDYVGIIRAVPKKLLMMYIHSFQSFVWNETVSEYLQSRFNDLHESSYSLGKFVFPDKSFDMKIPVVGFSTEFDNEEIEGICTRILAKQGIKPRDFVLKSIPDLSSEGSERDIFVDVQDLQIDYDKKEKICKLNFKLQKGSYATVVVKSMFC